MGMPRFVGERVVSEITGWSVSKLQNDRWAGRGIPYAKLGSSVRYDLEDVRAYIEARKIHPEAAR